MKIHSAIAALRNSKCFLAALVIASESAGKVSLSTLMITAISLSK